MAGEEPSESLQASTAYRSAAQVVLGYALAAALWILLSDLLLLIPPPGSVWIIRLSIAKGWLFVFVTSGLLYLLLRRHAHRILEAERVYHAAAERADEQKHIFFQNTIAAITEGKMLIRNPGVLDHLPTPAVVEAEVTSAEQVSPVRRQVRRCALAAGLPEERVADLVVAVGEAITNAAKHAGGGLVSMHVGTECTWVRVADQGPGIADLMLPRVALERGYTTKPSLGMGYALMLALADRVYLATGPTGTTVVIEMCRREAGAVAPFEGVAPALLAI